MKFNFSITFDKQLYGGAMGTLGCARNAIKPAKRGWTKEYIHEIIQNCEHLAFTIVQYSI